MSDQQINSLPVSVGLVGVGGIAQVVHLPLLKQHPDVEIRALCDTDTSKAAVLANKFGVPEVYGDIAEMLEREKPEVVFILTPNNLHLPMSLMALDSGAHVFLEKPAGRNAAEAIRIQERARAVNRHVMVGMQNRFRPDVLALRRFLQDEELGKLFYLKAGWLQARRHSMKQPWLIHQNVSGGGVAIDLGLQLIDLAWWLLGKPEPTGLNGFTYNLQPHLGVEDLCVAFISFKNELSLSLEVSWDFPAVKDHFYLDLVGEKGIGHLNPLSLQKVWHGDLVTIQPEIKENPRVHFKKGYENELNHFIDFLAGRTGVLESSIDEAVDVLKVIDTLYQTTREKQVGER